MDESQEGGEVIIGLNAVIVAVTEEEPRVLVVRHVEHALAAEGRPPAGGEAAPGGAAPYEALPFGPFYPLRHRTLEIGLRSWVREQTQQQLGYVEQLYTFGDRDRDPLERRGGPRVVSVGYLALAREALPAGAGDAIWQNWYRYFPWEDWRDGKPALLEEGIEPALLGWAAESDSPLEREEREQRLDIAFGLDAAWNDELVLERYELLYEAGLVTEALRDRGAEAEPVPDWADEVIPLTGRPMRLDHRRILATAMGRLRGKTKYRPVIFELMPPTFTLLQLQRAVEALAGLRLHKQNFRRLVEKSGLVEGTGRIESHTGGRPAEQFRFRREVLRERQTPGVRLPSPRMR